MILTKVTDFAWLKSDFTGFYVSSPSLHVKYMLTRTIDFTSQLVILTTMLISTIEEY
jgi:hypothetical protein